MMTRSTGPGGHVGMGHTPTGPTRGNPGSGIPGSPVGAPGPGAPRADGPARPGAGFGWGIGWGAAGGALAAAAVAVGFGLAALSEGDVGAALGLTVLVAAFGCVIGGVIGAIVGGVSGLVLGALRAERFAPVAAALLSVAVYAWVPLAAAGESQIEDALALLVGVPVFGGIGYLVGRGFARSMRTDSGHDVPGPWSGPPPSVGAEAPPWTWNR